MKILPGRIAAILVLSLLFTACSGAGIPNTGSASPTSGPANNLPAATPAATFANAQITNAAQPTANAANESPVPAISCTSPAPLTISQTEGPYFKANSPERASLLDSGIKGTKLVISGYVLTADCKPAAHALLDFWQANAQGQYDNSGYTLRGHQYTDENGRYQLETVVPGEYPGRTEHIHVKVQAPNGPVLTTQLYFPGAAGNSRDGIFDPSLLLTIKDSTSTQATAAFNFVIQAK